MLNKGFGLLVGLFLFSSVALASTSSEDFTFSGDIDPAGSFFGLDANTFALGNNLMDGGQYAVWFESEDFFSPLALTAALVSSGTAIEASALAPLGSGDAFEMDYFIASNGTDYFATMMGTSQFDYTLRVSLVPEMETWAMMIAGMGLIGWRLRNKKASV